MFKKLWGAVKAPAMKAIDKLQATFPVNRIVVLLTPLVFVPVSGFVAAWVAKHFPGLPQFTSAQILGFMVIGSTAALAAGYKFVDGWQKHEANIARSADLRYEASQRRRETPLGGGAKSAMRP